MLLGAKWSWVSVLYTTDLQWFFTFCEAKEAHLIMLQGRKKQMVSSDLVSKQPHLVRKGPGTVYLVKEKAECVQWYWCRGQFVQWYWRRGQLSVEICLVEEG